MNWIYKILNAIFGSKEVSPVSQVTERPKEQAVPSFQVISKNGLNLIKSFESFIPFVYDDLKPVKGLKYGYREWNGGAVTGTLSVGYGHTNAAGPPKITKGMRVTMEQASQILDDDLDKVEANVRRLVKVPLTQSQFDALVSFDFNTGGLSKSTLLKKLNAGDYTGASSEFGKWVKAKGKTLKGLVRRRNAERALFLGEDWKVF